MKKLQRRPNRFQGASVGLDLHKQFIQASVIDQLGDEISNTRIPATHKAINKLIDQLQKNHTNLQASFEASGCFLWVFDLFTERLERENIHVAAPSRVRVIANSQEKNDTNDAWWLAYLLFEGRLPQAFVAEGDLRELRIATRELRSVIDTRSDSMRRLKSHLLQLGLSFQSSDWHSKVGHQRITKLVEDVQQNHGIRGLAIKKLWQHIQHANDEVDFWRHTTNTLAENFGQIQQLQNLPGIGETIAAIIIGELGDPTRYNTAKAYAKATGLTPGYRESGGKSRSLKITREGSAHVRWALTRAILACMRAKQGDGLLIRQWVARQAKRKSKKAAMVAAARKLAQCIWRLFTLGEAFDLARAFNTNTYRYSTQQTKVA